MATATSGIGELGPVIEGEAPDPRAAHIRALLEADGPEGLRAALEATEPTGAPEGERAAILAELEEGAGEVGALLRRARKWARRKLRGPALVAPDFDAPTPDPVLWRDPPGSKHDYRDPLLPVGEVAILSGPGGVGKSTVVTAIAAAAGAPVEGEDFGRACGLRVKAGRVAILSYEDSGPFMARRMGWFGDPKRGRWDHARIACDGAAPLWTADPDDRRTAGPGPWWGEWWAAVREWRPALVAVDPSSVAFAGANPNDGAAVRAFLLAVSNEAKRGGFGVLLVSHDTKSARAAALEGDGPGAQAIAGSAQWSDGARGVLHFAGGLLTCSKSNYGPSGWGATLETRWDNPKDESGFRGYTVGRKLDRAGVAGVREGWKAKRGKRKPSKGANGRAGTFAPGEIGP